MDLKKEIKLSDLLPKRRSKADAPAEPKAEKPKKERRSLSFSRPKRASEPRQKPARKPRAQKAKGKSTSGGRAKKVVGLKIGASQIAAARVVNNGSPELVQVAREELDSGVIVGGELRETEELAAILKTFFRKHKLPRQNVRLGISNNRVGVRAFEIAGIEDGKQLANAIRYRAQETLPIPIEEAVLDYQILGERTDEEGVLHRKVLLVVAYRDLIDRYAAACRKAGIRLSGIDLEAFAILRALAPQLGEDAAASAFVVVNVGHDRTTFAVSDGKTCEFTRVLDWGGKSLDLGIAKALDLSPSEAAPIKLALSLAEPSTPAGLTSEQADLVREAVLREVHEFARELVSSLQFYQSQPGSLGIGEIVLTGGTAQLPGLAAEVSRLLGVRARVGDPLAHVKVGKKVDREQQLGSLTSAIGLGIEA
jgi:type IV pilus assembly protein PilM